MRWAGRRAGAIAHLLLAAVAYVPLLGMSRGLVGADTKQYLYLDPSGLMARAASVWDPTVAMGTVTHQNIGYLWPQGPWYWLAEAIGLPDWFAQRLWLATILFVAGAGVLFLLRVLGLRGVAAFVAALAYMLSPYLLTYAARITAILLPWAGLPWLIGFLALALRRGGWRYPAAFALVVTTVGSINATSLLYVGVAALAWVPFAVWTLREVTPRQALAALGRVALLTGLTQVWWLVALLLGNRYGAPVLQASETVEAVSTSSLASEVARGLGNWFFYGRDALGPWVEAAVPYTQEGWLIAVTFSLPILAVASAFVARWAYRAYFVLLVLVGAAVAVAAYPFDDPSPLGTAFKGITAASSIGLALRNAQRATPLLCLGTAVLLGLGVAAAGRRIPRGDVLAGLFVAALVLAAMPPLWEGTLVDRNLRRPEAIPSYWLDAADHLDERGDDTRVLEVPGSDFASYRWGNTVDPITPGLMSRPWVSRESAPAGSYGSIDLVAALDRRLQEGVFEPDALAPVARLMGVGDVLLRTDLQFERYRTPRPRLLWDLFTPPLPGLGRPVPFGDPVRNQPVPELPLLDELALGIPAGAPDPPPIAVFPVDDPLPIVRGRSNEGATILAGDGEGVVDAAAAGVLDPERLLVYSGTLAGEPELLDALLDGDPTLVVTDSNRKRARRWTAIRENTGYTEQAGVDPLREDPADARIDLFPDADPDEVATVVVLRGVRSVRATSYGNVVTYTPEDRPALAIDGDPTTAWRVGALGDPVGESWAVTLNEAVITDRIRLQQPTTGHRNRVITRARLTFDGGDPVVADLEPGTTTVEFPERTFERLEIVIEATNFDGAPPAGLSAVGLAEVGIDGITAEELVRLPTDLLDALGERSADHPLAIVLNRLRANAAEPVRADEERALARTFRLPAGRELELSGTARISAAAPDEVLDAVLGTVGPVAARSTARLPGSVVSRASSTLDGDPATAWQPPFGIQTGHELTYDLPGPTPVGRLDLVLVADGRHSVPTRLRLDGDGGEVRTVTIPPVADQAAEGATVAVPVTFDPLVTSTLRVTVEAVRELTTRDYFGGGLLGLPVGIAEIGLPGIPVRTTPDALAGDCVEDLLTVDGRPVAVRVTGSTEAAERREGLPLEACDGPLDLAVGDHDVRAAPGAETGVDVDRVLFESPGTAPVGDAPDVTVADAGRSSLRADVAGADGPFWLVLGQSWSEGWHAEVDGRDLGQPLLVDGYANGWLVDPDGATDLSVSLRWRPQRVAYAGLAVSGLAALACVVLVVGGRRRPGPDETPVPAAHVQLVWPWDRRPAVSGWAVTLVAAASAGVVAAVVLRPWAGPVVAAAAVLALRWRWGRAVLGVAAVGLLGLAGLYTLAFQVRNGPAHGFDWAARFERAHAVAWLALVLLAVDALVELVGYRAESRRPSGE